MHFIHIFLTANNVKQISINHLSCTYNNFNTPICVIVVRAAAVFIFNAIQKNMGFLYEEVSGKKYD